MLSMLSSMQQCILYSIHSYIQFDRTQPATVTCCDTIVEWCVCICVLCMCSMYVLLGDFRNRPNKQIYAQQISFVAFHLNIWPNLHINLYENCGFIPYSINQKHLQFRHFPHILLDSLRHVGSYSRWSYGYVEKGIYGCETITMRIVLENVGNFTNGATTTKSPATNTAIITNTGRIKYWKQFKSNITQLVYVYLGVLW